MTKLPTMAVKGTDGEKLIINVSDYDAKTHEIFNAKEKPLTDRELKIKYLKDSGVEHKGNISKKDLEALVVETQVKTAKVYLEDSEVEVAEDATDEEILALAKETAEKLAQK